MESPRVPEHPQRVYALTTRWSDEDRQGVLNNAAYLTLCEEARHRLCSEAGVLTNNEFPFVLAQANVRWLSPGVGGAEVLVELSTLEIGTTSFTQSYRQWCDLGRMRGAFGGLGSGDAPQGSLAGGLGARLARA